MACAAAVPKITFLPPQPPHAGLLFDQHIRGARTTYPVSADFRADGEISSPGLGFEDYTRCHTVYSKTIGRERRLETPAWALDDALLRSVLVRYMEYRAGYKTAQPGQEATRLQRAQNRINAQRPHKIELLDKVSREYVAFKKAGGDRKRLRELKIEIEGIDTELINSENIAAKVLRLVHLYYRAQLDSVGVAAELGTMKPPGVRQTIWRLQRVWERMQSPPKPPKWKTPKFVVRRNGDRNKSGPRFKLSALEVAVLRARGATLKQIATHFGVQKETCLRAIRRAKAAGIKITDYESYVEYAGRVGVNPMPYHAWRLLAAQYRPKQLPRHTMPFSEWAQS